MKVKETQVVMQVVLLTSFRLAMSTTRKILIGISFWPHLSLHELFLWMTCGEIIISNFHISTWYYYLRTKRQQVSCL